MAEGVEEASAAPFGGVASGAATRFGAVSRRLAPRRGRAEVGRGGVVRREGASRLATAAGRRGIGPRGAGARLATATGPQAGKRDPEAIVPRLAAAIRRRVGKRDPGAIVPRLATATGRRAGKRAPGAIVPRPAAAFRPLRARRRGLSFGFAGAGLGLALAGCSPEGPGAGRAGNGTGADTAAAGAGDSGIAKETAAAGGGAASLPRPELHPGMPGLLNQAEVAALGAARERALGEIAHLPEFGFGEAAGPERIAAWDIDIGPDGEGLPAGRGSVERGETLYRLQCVQCHGLRGEGADFEALAGRVPGDAFPFAEQWRYPITVGSYWPYATTLFDYLRRAMPQAAPGTLPPNDVYSLTAYVLHLNDLLEPGATLDADSLPRIVMPARDRFVRDDRRGGPEVR